MSCGKLPPVGDGTGVPYRVEMEVGDGPTEEWQIMGWADHPENGLTRSATKWPRVRKWRSVVNDESGRIVASGKGAR